MGDTQPHGHAGAAIRILRDIRKWSQGKLAEEAKIHLNTVSRFEADPSSAQTDTLQKLAKALGQTAAGVNLLAERLSADGHLDLVKLSADRYDPFFAAP